MGLSFIGGVTGSADGSGTTLDASAALTLQAGDVIVTWSKWEGATAPTLSVADTGAGNACTTTTLIDGSGAFFGGFAYLLSSGAGSITFRQTLSAARTFRRFIVGQWRPDSGDVVTYQADGGAFGSSAAPNSGNITVSGSDLLVCGAYGEFAAADTSAEQINGVAATEVTGSPINFTSMWYRLVGSGFTGAASATISANDWICGAIGFSSDPGTPDPMNPHAILKTLRPAIFKPGHVR